MDAINMKNLTKIYGDKVIANDDINFVVKKGSIHALIGENGAGKSTLMSILFGLIKPTKGEIFINGERVNIKSPNEASELGLGMVHQHFKLIENFRAWENIILGSEPLTSYFTIDKNYAKEKLKALCKEYNLAIDLDKKISSMSVGEQQRVEIMKMLYRSSDILIFDEPTAVLSPQEIDGLLKAFKEFQKNGKTIIFITHKLNEIQEVCDTATVLRLGKHVKTFDPRKFSSEQISEFMVGSEVEDIKNDKIKKSKNVLMKINDLKMHEYKNSKIIKVNKFNLNINEGEILSIAGLEGNGQKELFDAITGLQKPMHGTIEWKSENEWLNVNKLTIRKRRKIFLSAVPEDRQEYGMVMSYSVINNAIINDFYKPPFSRFGFMIPSAAKKFSQMVIHDFGVRAALHGVALMSELSGGNQQKVIVGREMLREHKLLVLFQPTRGLDVGAISNIHKLILDEKEKGTTVLIISYELDEILSISDRIIVMNNGKIINDFYNDGKKSKIDIGEFMSATLEKNQLITKGTKDSVSEIGDNDEKNIK